MKRVTLKHSAGSAFDKNNNEGRSRGFGFVTFETTEQAQAAIDGMNEQDLDGRTIRVNMANDRPSGGDRGDRGDRGGFGGRGRGGYGNLLLLFPSIVLSRYELFLLETMNDWYRMLKKMKCEMKWEQ